MNQYKLEKTMAQFRQILLDEEHSDGTVKKYLRDVRAFWVWLGERELSKEATAQWRESLREGGYRPVTINSMLSALNRFLRMISREDCRVRFLRIQRRAFRDPGRDLNKRDYQSLLEAAERKGNLRLRLIMETICATGIRVSELRYITVEAAAMGRAEISLKGKIRTILLPGKLCRKLLKYAKKAGAFSGAIFRTKTGKSISRCQIWREMKRLSAKAGVSPTKVFPHNLRHLFATVFYRACKDIVKLADVLGHSSIETTRIYLLTTGQEHIQRLERLELVL
ncbi:MAG: integrase [Clostridiaceae bacterium]|nr:MAG: integrase [Clostridiaceae bacterium]